MAPDASLMRRLVRDSLDIPLKEMEFVRCGQRNLWIRHRRSLLHAVGFYGTWQGGTRNLEWGVWIPEVHELLYSSPRDVPQDISQCHLRGDLFGLLGPGDFPERARRLKGTVPALMPGDDVGQSIDTVRECVALFLGR